MQQLGKMEQIQDLRTIWAHEEYNFSRWLAHEENLALLNATLDIDLILEERESSVGNFSVDLFGTEAETGRKVIIENQLEESDHDHLGKIITYASGKDAEVIVWIVKKARDEHRQAVVWLNQHTDENIGFFLLEIQLWKISDSLPAPKFNIVEQPNNWAKVMKNIDNLSDTKKVQLDFWTKFNSLAFARDDIKKIFTSRKASPRHWYDLSVGSSLCHICLTANTQKKIITAEIYFNDNKELFESLRKKQIEIEQEICVKAKWIEARKNCRLIITHDADIKQGEDAWPAQIDWLCNMAVLLRGIIKKYIVE
jgi:hypothetical protein